MNPQGMNKEEIQGLIFLTLGTVLMFLIFGFAGEFYRKEVSEGTKCTVIHYNLYGKSLFRTPCK